MYLSKLIFGWIALWLGSWYGWIFFVKKGLHYIKTYRIAAGYFTFLSIIVWMFYRNHLFTFFSHLQIKIFPFYFLSLFFIGVFGIYHYSHKIFGRGLLSSHIERKILTATMDYRFLIAKSFDILFQQILFLSLLVSLKGLLVQNSLIILICGVIFGTVHLPLLVIKHNALAIYFVIFSFFAGILFSYLILFLPYGFIYAYILHWSFYIFIGVVINIWFMKKKKHIKKLYVS